MVHCIPCRDQRLIPVAPEASSDLIVLLMHIDLRRILVIFRNIASLNVLMDTQDGSAGAVILVSTCMILKVRACSRVHSFDKKAQAMVHVALRTDQSSHMASRY